MAKVKKKFQNLFHSNIYRFAEVVLSHNENVCVYGPLATLRRELQLGQLTYYALNISNSSN